MDPVNSLVVEIPVSLGDRVRTLQRVTVWEQLQLAALLQRVWADNQVSCTATFDAAKGEDAQEISHALDYFQYQLKGVSFLPRAQDAYPQMPYEEISREQFEARAQGLHALRLAQGQACLSHASNEVVQDPLPENYCDADRCKI